MKTSSLPTENILSLWHVHSSSFHPQKCFGRWFLSPPSQSCAVIMQSHNYPSYSIPLCSCWSLTLTHASVFLEVIPTYNKPPHMVHPLVSFSHSVAMTNELSFWCSSTMEHLRIFLLSWWSYGIFWLGSFKIASILEIKCVLISFNFLVSSHRAQRESTWGNWSGNGFREQFQSFWNMFFSLWD